jgi:hypothetical protein
MPFVKAGTPFVIDIPSGNETLAWTGIVGEDCKGAGYWYCDTCRVSLAHNMDMQNHRKHELMWICFEHGPETVTN